MLALVGCRTAASPAETPELTATIEQSTSTMELTGTPTSTISQSNLVLPTATTKFSRQIALAEKLWQLHSIAGYHITLRFYENFLNAITTTRDVTVIDGQVVSSSCVADECPAFALRDVYSVDDLFYVARGATLALMFEGLADYDDCVRSLEFDKIYGFPRLMEVDCSNAYDEDHRFEVTSFEVLK